MKLLVVGSALLSFGGGLAHAQTLLVTSNPATMTVTGAVAGSQPLTVTENSTTYTVSALVIQPKKITAQINTDTPTGVTLTVLLVAPSGATSAGRVALDITARDVVTNITNTVPQARTIEYQLTATVSAGVIPVSTRTVTLTLVNYP
ncbi:MAG: hypothetical protein AUI63_07150 [Gemmatimonadetes bacterium 13_1_40CM_2_60_3]|nr:MAG: hypothetical protein AUI63_07150 [Gemmatimonadetes bacterium 13_1_40CM_2_60_3]